MSSIIYPIIQQGIIVPPGQTIYIAKNLYEGVISNIKISNITSSSIISLRRYIRSLNITVLLYRFELDMGDVVNDDTEYKIKSGDYLYLESDAIGTAYAISGMEGLSS